MEKDWMFDEVFVIGIGDLARKCSGFLSQMGRNVTFCDANPESSPKLRKQCEAMENVRYSWYRKKALFESIKDFSGRALIISAVNPYIIPDDIVGNDRFKAVNLHHALLPKHPGRNAECWAIYEEDKEAGITWHVVGSQIDGGDILAQASVEIGEDMTAWRLLKVQNKLAYEEFEKLADRLLRWDISGEKQDPRARGQLHFSYEKPNDGIIDMKWSGHKISAFLRSMDYGPVRVLGLPKICMEDDVKEIQRYEIRSIGTEYTLKADHVEQPDEKTVIIMRDGYEFICNLM